MVKILGLDLGTNSIGWAVAAEETNNIIATGSRIIPMDGETLGDFEKGKSVHQTAERTAARSSRHLRERYLLRRERLIRTLKMLGFLPEHYTSQTDNFGHILGGKQPKIAWREGKEGEMEFLFKSSFKEMVEEFNNEGYEGKIPYDWTIYYLRKKALTMPISKDELSWVLMSFNHKRGYNQLRAKDELGDDFETKIKKQEYVELEVVDIHEGEGKDKKGQQWYDIVLSNGWIYKRALKRMPDWIGKKKAFVATYKLDKQGNRTNEQHSLSLPSSDDWTLKKIRTEQNIHHANLTVGEYIYNLILHNPNEKIIGSAVGTIDRSFYREEIKAILNNQRLYHPELTDKELFIQCLESLYPSNDIHRKELERRDIVFLLIEDILFYQRPLKTKKNLISNCPFEHNGEYPVKCIPKSHPLYQEFRIWQWLSNLRIFLNEGVRESDVTSTLLPNTEAYSTLYKQLQCTKEIDQNGLLKLLNIGNKEMSSYRWNYPQDKKYPTGETHLALLTALRKAGLNDDFLNNSRELSLWHILYSIDDVEQYGKALHTFARKENLNTEQQEAFFNAFRKAKVYKTKDYGAYSHKALTKILPLIRHGSFWKAENIDTCVVERIEHLNTGEADDLLTPKIRTLLSGITDVGQCIGLPLHLACYLIYGRHSETMDTSLWTSPNDIDIYLSHFKQHSLNNPVVEQVVTESLRVVRDVWSTYGKPDEIHIELGRELKKTNRERERLSNTMQDNENTNQRIRLLLMELANPDSGVEGVRPYSPSQQELLKIYEEGALLDAGDTIPDYIVNIKNQMSSIAKAPSHNDILRYKLWLEQHYFSSYTGEAIPLARLFTSEYQIEHIIPQSRFFDDSFSNKVICESEVNKLKDRMLAHEFITQYHGQIVTLSAGRRVKIMELQEYEELIGRIYAGNKKKLNNLMLDEIPKEFLNRQLNDTRYISRLMLSLLARIVRTEDENGDIERNSTAKNIIATNGSITDRLKHDWGLDDVWNRIILPRFVRMNNIDPSNTYTSISAQGHLIPSIPLSERQGFSKKRIDHRHHAMDAIVIALTTRNHINLLNNLSAEGRERHDLQEKLRNKEIFIGNDGKEHTRFTTFKKPWDTFTQDAYAALQDVVVSFKQNLRVINKTSNYYYAYRNGKKVVVKQSKGDSWAIRKALHKDTVYGEVNLQRKKRVSIREAINNVKNIVDRELKAKILGEIALHYTPKQIIEYLNNNKDLWSEAADGKIEVYYYTKDTPYRYFATRKDLISHMAGCTNEAAAKKKIFEITDTGIQRILLSHLANENYDVEDAFSSEGIQRMNENIVFLNNGHHHEPIKRVRVYEQASKFSIGKTGLNSKKFVEAAKGTNLFFVIYIDEKGKRGYATIPFYIAYDLQKRYQKQWKEHIIEELQKPETALIPQKSTLLYLLSPNDLVYVPTPEQIQNGISAIDKTRIYKVVSCSQKEFACREHRVAGYIVDKFEFTGHNKSERAITGEMIKEVCVPIVVDRLGNIIKIG